MSPARVPSETRHADAVTRHTAREAVRTVRDHDEFEHAMAYSKGVRLYVMALTDDVVGALEGAGFTINGVSTAKHGALSMEVEHDGACALEGVPESVLGTMFELHVEPVDN